MHHYVDQMNFTGMEFVKALRHFLEGFRLPGKIDFFSPVSLPVPAAGQAVLAIAQYILYIS
jgi:hypothetical protein